MNTIVIRYFPINYLYRIYFIFILVESEEFKKGVNELAALMKVTQHPDHLVTLEAICSLIASSLDKDSIEEKKPEVNTHIRYFHFIFFLILYGD